MIEKTKETENINFLKTNTIMINSNSSLLRTNNSNKNFLMVNGHIQGQSDDEILDDIESSN
jgi:hypothetical protein